MYGLTTIHKINREAAEAAAILAKYPPVVGEPATAAPQQPVATVASKG